MKNFLTHDGLATFLADGLTRFPNPDGIPTIIDEESQCNAFKIDCSSGVQGAIEDVPCGGEMQFACMGRCNPDGEMQKHQHI